MKFITFAMSSTLQSNPVSPREGYVPVDRARLYFRDIGKGQSILILHGGPDFDHTYLLPEMDHLSDSFRLWYYDQRGRGRSAEAVQPEDVDIESEVNDMESLRKHFHLESTAVLGHSWGGVLALEYAIRHPDRVSHLILVNTAPASHDDYMLLRQELPKRRAADDVEKMNELSSTAAYQEGDPETVAGYYRIHFRATVKKPEYLGKVIHRLRQGFTQPGILKARRIEDRLKNETWLSDEYNLFPQLEKLEIPTLVIHGDYDFIPVECAAHIARAIPDARFVLLEDCGHFSYLEHTDQVYKIIRDFLLEV
jgi:proline iminopeptidase